MKLNHNTYSPVAPSVGTRDPRVRSRKDRLSACLGLRAMAAASVALLALLLAACTDEINLPSAEQWQQGDTPYYVRLRLNTPSDSFSRDSESADGESADGEDTTPQDWTHGDLTGTATYAAETAIAPDGGHFAIFFDGDDNYISWADLYAFKPSSQGSGYDEKTYTCRFYGFAEREPEKVLVVVNASPKIYRQVTNFPGHTLSEVYKQIWREDGQIKYDVYSTNDGVREYRMKVGDKGVEYTEDPYENLGFRRSTDGKLYFTMTNTAFVDGLDTSNPKVYCAEPIPTEAIHKGTEHTQIDSDELEEDETIPPVTVYLERMVSKFDLALDNFNPEVYTPINAANLDVCKYSDDGNSFQYIDKSWSLRLLGWGLNGLETENYLFKNIDPKGKYFKDSKEDNKFGWNDPDRKRCFWSEDPHYEKDVANTVVYPWQFHFGADSYDDEHIDWYEHFQYYQDPKDMYDEGKKYALTYYPFTKFCDIWDYTAHPDAQGNCWNDKFTSDNAFNDYNVVSGSNRVFYTPENTFWPGQQVDRSRGTRAYELANTHVLLAAQLLDSEGKPITESATNGSGYFYRNRVGVCYEDEFSLCMDFINAVNYKLESQKHLYYKYYPWNENEVSEVKRKDTKMYYGHTLRTESSGKYALYCYLPAFNGVVEINSDLITLLTLDKYKDNYRLTREADAINADGKVIPWICYKNGDEYVPADIYILRKSDNEDDYGLSDTAKNWAKETHSTSGVTNVCDLNWPDKDRNGTDRTYTFEFIYGNPKKSSDPSSGYNEKTHDYVSFRKLSFSRKSPGIENGADQKDENGDGWYDFFDGERDDNDVQSIFYEIWGVADCFNHGLMYYAVPINAINIKRGIPAVDRDHIKTSELDTSLGLADEALFYGYHGVIRNNYYRFKLHSIREVGIPVTDPTLPIVPNYTNKKDQIKMEMEVLQWHVEDQTVFID